MTIDRATHYDQLQDQIGDIRHKDGKGYHDGAQCEDWLDFTVRPENWSFKILEHGRDEESDEVWVSGELSVTFWVPDANGMVQPLRVTKQNFGGQQIKRFKAKSDGQGGMILGKPISIADDRKGAATDCLKRCARLLGVSRYLWRKPDSLDLPYRRDEEEEAARNAPARRPQAQQEAPAARNGAGQAPTPISDGAAARTAPARQEDRRATPEEVGTYEVVRAEAKVAGFRASWLDQDPSGWTIAWLTKRQTLMEEHLARRPAVAS